VPSVIAEMLADQILQRVDEAPALYYRLILVVGPSGAGKTASLRAVAARTGTTLLNVNLELSRHMLDLTVRQRALKAPRLLSDIANAGNPVLILLDNTEMLFDVSLKQDPLRLLQGLSRNRTVVATWSGAIEDTCLTYAVPDHLEYRRYPTKDLLIVTPQVNQ